MKGGRWLETKIGSEDGKGGMSLKSLESGDDNGLAVMTALAVL